MAHCTIIARKAEHRLRLTLRLQGAPSHETVAQHEASRARASCAQLDHVQKTTWWTLARKLYW